MGTFKETRVNEGLGLLGVCFVGAVVGFYLGNRQTFPVKASAPVAVRQTDEKSIQISHGSDELLDFRDISVKHTKISSSGKFSVSSLGDTADGEVGDWLKDLQFTLKNKTDRQINYIQFELQFLDTMVDGPLMVYTEFGLGIHPNSESLPKRGSMINDKPLALNPSAKVTASLSDDHLRRIKHFIGLRNFQLGDLNRVVIKVISVIFDDGIMWSSGHFYKPNPDAPGGYQRIN